MRDEHGGERIGELTDQELRVHQRFVSAFEAWWKRLGLGEPTDRALREAAWMTGRSFQELRVAHYLRDALAHDKWVDRSCLDRQLAMLQEGDIPPEVGRRALHRPNRPGTTAIRVHAWRDRNLERHMIADGFVSVAGADIADLTNADDPELIRQKIAESMPNRSPAAISILTGYWRRFILDAETGDVVVLPTQTLDVAVGEFAGEYFYMEAADPGARHRRPVGWIRFGIPGEEFDEDLQQVLFGRHTVQTFKSPDAAERLRRIAYSRRRQPAELSRSSTPS